VTSKAETSTTNNSQNCEEKRTWKLTFQNFRISGFEIPRLQKTKHQPQTIPEIAEEKWVWKLTFQNFRIQGFGVSNVKPQHTTITKFRKVKGCGTNTLGFWVFGFQGYKIQTIAHNNSRIQRGERVWNQHFGILVFGVSGLQNSNHSTQQSLNFESIKT
jgi:hypothetical protein